MLDLKPGIRVHDPAFGEFKLPATSSAGDRRSRRRVDPHVPKDRGSVPGPDQPPGWSCLGLLAVTAGWHSLVCPRAQLRALPGRFLFDTAPISGKQEICLRYGALIQSLGLLAVWHWLHLAAIKPPLIKRRLV